MKYEISELVPSQTADLYQGGTSNFIHNVFLKQLDKLMAERKRNGNPVGTFEIELSFTEAESNHG